MNRRDTGFSDAKVETNRLACGWIPNDAYFRTTEYSILTTHGIKVGSRGLYSVIYWVMKFTARFYDDEPTNPTREADLENAPRG